MDDIRDIQKGDDFSKFIDAQNVWTDPFGNNRVAERLYRRVERVTAALYLLTRHVPSEEPLRQQVRILCTDLFKKVLDLKDEMRAVESSALLAFQSHIRNLISLTRMLTAGGFVSFQNAETVIAALDDLGSFASSSQRSALAEGVTFTKEDLTGDTSPLSDKSFIKDIKDKRIVKDKSAVRDSIEERSVQRHSQSTAARAEGILAVLHGSGEVGIREIAARLPDYSEKMIQRELADLVKAGQVKKAGFKRWSKYSLAQ